MLSVVLAHRFSSVWLTQSAERSALSRSLPLQWTDTRAKLVSGERRVLLRAIATQTMGTKGGLTYPHWHKLQMQRMGQFGSSIGEGGGC